MEHVITENLIVDVENEDEEFALVECPLSPEEGPQDYYSYYAYDKKYRLVVKELLDLELDRFRNI